MTHSFLARAARLRVHRVHVDGRVFRLLHPGESGIHADARGGFLWEPALSSVIQDLIRDRPDTTFLDVGGAFGYFSHLVKTLQPSARVHAFEPNWRRRAIFAANNVLNRRAIPVHPQFVGARTAAGTITLDDFCGAHSLVPTLVKIDIEGGEYDALAGMTGVCREHAPVLLIELHERILREQMGRSASVVLETLASFGYRIEYLNHHRSAGGRASVKPNDVNYEVVASRD